MVMIKLARMTVALDNNPFFSMEKPSLMNRL